MRWWKVLGLAGVAGVAATGVVVARSERRRRAYTPEEGRDRLRSRLADASDANDQLGEEPTGCFGDLVDRLVERFFVGARRRAHPRDLADVLQRSSPNVVDARLLDVRRSQGLDASAHASVPLHVTAGRRATSPGSPPGRRAL